MAEGTTYFKATIEMHDNNRNVQIEIGPNLQGEDAILSISVLLNSLASVYNCSLNDLLIGVTENSLKIQREKAEHERTNAINAVDRYMN